ncbi:MAG: hypothetical protein JWO52_245 [Gammaproteobacteria bacterium]|nr:hypothetical protein [Gammaproteobacteria bacterium]
MPGARLLPCGLVGRAGSQQNPSFPHDASEREYAAWASDGLEHARRCLSTEATVEDAQYHAPLRDLEGVGESCHRQARAGEIRGVGVEQHQVTIRRAVPSE